MGGLTRVFCGVLLAPAGDDLFLPAPLPCGSCSAFPRTRARKSPGIFTEVGDLCFYISLAAHNECAQNGEVFNEMPEGDGDLYR